MFVATFMVFGTQLVDLAIKALDCSQPELLGGEYFYRSKQMGGNVEVENEPQYSNYTEAYDAIWKNHKTFQFTNRLDQRFYCGRTPDSKEIDPALSAFVALPMSLICIAILYVFIRGDIRLEIFIQAQKILAVLLIAYDVKGRSLILGICMLLNFGINHYSDRLLPNHRNQAKIMYSTLFLFCMGGAYFEFVTDPEQREAQMRYIGIFWLISCTLVIACLVSITILIAFEYRDLVDLLWDDYKIIASICCNMKEPE